MHKSMESGQPKQFVVYCKTANSQLTLKQFKKIQHF